MAITTQLEELITQVESAEGLDPLARGARAVGSKILGGPRTKDVLSGRAIGHPLHPGLTLVAGGSLLGATILDVVGGPSARDAARRLVGAGLLAALPTALAGVSDWLDTEGAESRIGTVHAASNLLAVAAYSHSWRRRGRGHSGLVSGLLGAMALTAGGWLGGHLTFAQGVGVDTTAFGSGPADWTDLAASPDITESLKCFEVGGEQLLATRVRDEVVVIANRCTHRGAPLSDGERVGECVTCPWHRSVFALQGGAVLRGPASRPQPAYEVREADGRIQIRRREVRSLRTNPAGG
ncbi:MAG TPA: Rieske (2Fe-2S) protein [Mycobacteriales bacterium]|nr:Rieske (2Fe-2S) protein [Mycobacteriales bacterium]